MPRASLPVSVPLHVAPGGGPLRHRVADSVVAAIRDGRLRPGDPLPSTRALATELGVSRGPVVAAYDELLSAGFVVARPGSGTVVAPRADKAAGAGATTHVAVAPQRVSRSSATTSTAVRLDLRPGRPDVGLIDERAWQRAWKAAGQRVRPAYASPIPHEELRGALVDHVRRTRGITTSPEQVVLVPGVTALLQALPEALGWRGRTVALEDPGYQEAWAAFERAGVRTRALAVDGDGLDPGLLRDGDRAAYVTPSHQYPFGGRMPVARRAALLQWATRTRGVVVEDDYDGDFRYDVSPLPALRALPGADEHVVHIGTASKLLSPSLRVAWVVAPDHLVRPLSSELNRRGLFVNDVTGLALARLLTSGALTRHHARASRTYAARRAAFVGARARHVPDGRVTGIDAGLHAVLELPDADDLALVDALADKGLRCNPLSAYCVERELSGLVLNYAVLPETQADEAARTIAAGLAVHST